MENRKISKKTILKIVGALLALAYLGFCLYAGISGKFLSMHKEVHVMRFGELKIWVSGGLCAIMLFSYFTISIRNDLISDHTKKNSFLPYFLTLILPAILIILLESYLDIGWIGITLYAGIAVFLFGIAWIPEILNRLITRQLLRDESMSGKQQVQIIEWIHFHPLKKLFVFGLWGFGVVLVLRGIWVIATGTIEIDGGLVFFLFGTAVLVVVLFSKMRHYVFSSYQNIPVLNRILNQEQLETLLDGECFERVEFEDEGMNQYLEIYQSQNWMLIGGKLLSKKLALWYKMNRYNSHSIVQILYLSGKVSKAKVDLPIHESRYIEFGAVLKQLIGYEGALKLYEKEEQMAQKFESYFPEQTSEQERIITFLNQDATAIRQDYIQTFSADANLPKKKQNNRKRKFK